MTKSRSRWRTLPTASPAVYAITARSHSRATISGPAADAITEHESFSHVVPAGPGAIHFCNLHERKCVRIFAAFAGTLRGQLRPGPMAGRGYRRLRVGRSADDRARRFKQHLAKQV